MSLVLTLERFHVLNWTISCFEMNWNSSFLTSCHKNKIGVKSTDRTSNYKWDSKWAHSKIREMRMPLQLHNRILLHHYMMKPSSCRDCVNDLPLTMRTGSSTQGWKGRTWRRLPLLEFSNHLLHQRAYISYKHFQTWKRSYWWVMLMTRILLRCYTSWTFGSSKYQEIGY